MLPEVKNFGIFVNFIVEHRLGYNNHTTLYMPSDDDLELGLCELTILKNELKKGDK